MTSSDNDDDVIEDIFNCDIEGGGEEDTSNYDIATLQCDFSSSTAR